MTQGGRVRPKAVVVALLAVVVFIGLIGLGVWQLQRRTWKLALIAAVDARVHAAPAPAPGPPAWPQVIAASYAYRHVVVRGKFRHDRETLVQALTEQGAGFWVMTPLVTRQGFTVLIDRGFVPADRADPATRASGQTRGQTSGETTVTGLLRLTEPHGGFLRANSPNANRWYSRDVAAIAAARGLTNAAPYFIDADATPNPGGLPVGGLTVIAFPNSHLVYALTWFGLAVLLAGGCVIGWRSERRR